MNLFMKFNLHKQLLLTAVNLKMEPDETQMSGEIMAD